MYIFLNSVDPGKEKSTGSDPELPKPIFGENLLGKSYHIYVESVANRVLDQYFWNTYPYPGKKHKRELPVPYYI